MKISSDIFEPQNNELNMGGIRRTFTYLMLGILRRKVYPNLPA